MDCRLECPGPVKILHIRPMIMRPKSHTSAGTLQKGKSDAPIKMIVKSKKSTPNPNLLTKSVSPRPNFKIKDDKNTMKEKPPIGRPLAQVERSFSSQTLDMDDGIVISKLNRNHDLRIGYRRGKTCIYKEREIVRGVGRAEISAGDDSAGSF